MSAPNTDRGALLLYLPQHRCDFCAADLRGTAYSRFPARNIERRPGEDIEDIEDQDSPTVTLLGAWGACDGCAPLVRRRSWPDLVRRVLAAATAAGLVGPDRRQQRVARWELRGMYRQLDKALTGDEVRVGAAS